jgi:hypothetical protein
MRWRFRRAKPSFVPSNGASDPDAQLDSAAFWRRQDEIDEFVAYCRTLIGRELTADEQAEYERRCAEINSPAKLHASVFGD